MCGIAGFIDRNGQESSAFLKAAATAMCDAVRHRGPDDSGVWTDQTAGIALGHRRLSILDLSPEGHQPMFGAAGRFVIVFNGEVYNFLEIRSELESNGYPFRGHSDTEVMLAAFDRWGVETSVRRFNGMFAFALWDRQERTLYLCRDRLGKKPLYYGWCGRTLLFGSELKALRTHPSFRTGIDRNALGLYMRLGYIPSPHTIYEGIHKLPPGTLLAIPASDIGGNREPVPYWSAVEAAVAGLNDPIPDAHSCLEQLDSLLRSAVGLRMVADVPLGAFLSGGIDSSLVVGIMQALSNQPVKTFCIGFHERTHNEADHARAVACHLGTEHTELTLTPGDALAVVPRLPRLFDEPFADSSQIPTFLVSELARRRVTVSLSGDGGDELFAGYNAYRQATKFYAKYGWLPPRARSLAARVLTAIPKSAWNAAFNGRGAMMPASARAKRLAATLSEGTRSAIYMNLMSIWEDPAQVVPGALEPPTAFSRDVARDIPDVVGEMQLLDSLVYLPDDILVKVDRASMAVALEARAPLLDYRVYELAWRIPLDLKIKGGTGKWILRQLLDRYVPRELVDRPKSGFAVPIAEWLRGPLRTWAGDMLSPDRLRRDGFLDPGVVNDTWESHQKGYDWSARLWAVLMFQCWISEAGTRPAAVPTSLTAS